MRVLPGRFEDVGLWVLWQGARLCLQFRAQGCENLESKSALLIWMFGVEKAYNLNSYILMAQTAGTRTWQVWDVALGMSVSVLASWL